MVFAKRPLGTSKGRLVWREPLVWAAADTFDLIPGAALPLALYRERSVSCEAAARCAPGRRTHLGDRLHHPEPDRRARGGPCGPGHYAASCERGHRGLAHSRAEAGLPRLPDLEFAIYEKARPDKAAAALTAALLALAQGPSRPTI